MGKSSSSMPPMPDAMVMAALQAGAYVAPRKTGTAPPVQASDERSGRCGSASAPTNNDGGGDFLFGLATGIPIPSTGGVLGAMMHSSSGHDYSASDSYSTSDGSSYDSSSSSDSSSGGSD